MSLSQIHDLAEEVAARTDDPEELDLAACVKQLAGALADLTEQVRGLQRWVHQGSL